MPKCNFCKLNNITLPDPSSTQRCERCGAELSSFHPSIDVVDQPHDSRWPVTKKPSLTERRMRGVMLESTNAEKERRKGGMGSNRRKDSYYESGEEKVDETGRKRINSGA